MELRLKWEICRLTYGLSEAITWMDKQKEENLSVLIN